MADEARNWLEGLMASPRESLLLAAALLGAVTSLDALTSWELGFAAFYVLPLLLATWAKGVRWGILVAFLCAGIWYTVDRISGHPYSQEFFRIWDGLNHLLAYLVVAVITGILRGTLLKERALRKDLRDSLEEIEELEGLLPVCAWCKRVRDDEGYWQEVAAFLQAKGRRRVTHGICPECGKTLKEQI